MQPRDYAMLVIWQAQREAGIPPEDRLLPRMPTPANDPDSFERDLETIRKCIERAI